MLCGPACTVKVFPGDNLMVHKALDVAQARRHHRGRRGRLHPERRARRPDLDQGATPRDRRLHRRRPDPRPARDPAARLPGLRPRDHADRPAAPRARGRSTTRSAAAGSSSTPATSSSPTRPGSSSSPGRSRRSCSSGSTSTTTTNRAYLESVRRGDFSNRWVDQLLEEHHCPILETAADATPERHRTGPTRDGAWPANGLAAALVDGAFDAVTPDKDLA